MARRKSREELEREISRLQAYEEAFYVLRGPAVDARETTFASGDDDDTRRSISVIGLARPSGGVVVSVDGIPCVPRFLCDWCQAIERGLYDPYTRDVASKARRAQADAVNARMPRGAVGG